MTAIVAVLALCGTAAPLTWEPGATGLGKLALPVVHADSGRGSGDDGGVAQVRGAGVATTQAPA